MDLTAFQPSVKASSEHIAPFLARLFQQSIDTGEVPNDLEDGDSICSV